MQFVATNDHSTLFVHNTRSLTLREQQLITANFLIQLPEFLIDLVLLQNGFNQDLFVRSVLFQLPFLIGGFRDDGPWQLRDMVPSDQFFFFCTSVGYYPTRTGEGYQMWVPSSYSACRSDLHRFKTSNFAKALPGYKEIFYYGKRSFCNLLGLFLNEVEAIRLPRFGAIPVGASKVMELTNLGEHFLDLVLGGEFHNSRACSRLMLHFNNVYGESNALFIWRLTGFNDYWNMEPPEELFCGSVIQTQMYL
ncbi:P0 [Zucchini aphid-borne yellows virus]|uniref:P0 n=1 Tax=Zucchini aphid-borne yellows virus TaxID=2527960 RepID=A0A411NPY6_9VIRU|nr:P0 [Zucchini aphid-borne yellows virus]